MRLSDELEGIAAAARAFERDGEALAAVIPAEPAAGRRIYLCAFERAGARTWLALDGAAAPVLDRGLVRDAASIAALCELAEDSAAGGSPSELRLHLEELASVEGRELVAEAGEALALLEATLEQPPRVASSAYLDRVGSATRALERALGEIGASPFAEAMKQGSLAVEGLTAEVEDAYKLPLD